MVINSYLYYSKKGRENKEPPSAIWLFISKSKWKKKKALFSIRSRTYFIIKYESDILGRAITLDKSYLFINLGPRVFGDGERKKKKRGRIRKGTLLTLIQSFFCVLGAVPKRGLPIDKNREYLLGERGTIDPLFFAFFVNII